MRDMPPLAPAQDPEVSATVNGDDFSPEEGNGLRDSLWTFEGNDMKVWTEIQDVLRSAPSELGRELPPMVSIPVDFYPLSVLLPKGILLGLEPDLVQRRDVNFAFFRFTIRVSFLCPCPRNDADPLDPPLHTSSAEVLLISI
jgi:hypothetical protein